MKKILFISMLISAPTAVMAGGTEGGTPPAREKLLEQLMSADLGRGALFDNGLGDLGLLTNRELQPQMTLTKSLLLKADIKVPETDFGMLRDRKLPIDSVGSSGENKSFQISAGDQLDSLILTDRRAVARSSVTQ
ncbi:MAG: hypothetical protein M3Q07_07985 [Pseudobdellovibrionaceae bacterium]|nr:hypothetical protein [Pseudobdellovibrionaceae bacterium]